MGIEKAEVKRAAFQEVGKRFESRKDNAEIEVRRCEGAIGGLKEAAEKLDQHKGYWKKDFKDDKISDKELQLAIKVIDQCGGIVRNLQEAASARKLMHQGEVHGLQGAMDICEKLFETEGRKAMAILDAVEKGIVHSQADGDGTPHLEVVPDAETADGRPVMVARPVGVHPGLNDAQRRKPQADAKEGDPHEEDSKEVVEEVPPKEEKKKRAPRRVRKKKGSS